MTSFKEVGDGLRGPVTRGMGGGRLTGEPFHRKVMSLQGQDHTHVLMLLVAQDTGTAMGRQSSQGRLGKGGFWSVRHDHRHFRERDRRLDGSVHLYLETLVVDLQEGAPLGENQDAFNHDSEERHLGERSRPCWREQSARCLAFF